MLTLAMGTIAAPEKAYACSCAAPPSVQDELSRKTAVFAGTVTEVNKPNKEILDYSADLVEVVFNVEQVWKGELSGKTKVYTALGSESCGYEGFEPGEKYIVSAYGSTDRLETGMCEMTKPIGLAKSALEELGAGREPSGRSGGGAELAAAWLWAFPVIAIGAIALLIVRAKRRGGE